MESDESSKENQDPVEKETTDQNQYNLNVLKTSKTNNESQV